MTKAQADDGKGLSRLDHRIARLIFLLAFTYGAYFYQASLSNQNARLNVAYSIAEGHQPLFSISRFFNPQTGRLNTTDWSVYQDQFYSNKAPGSAMLAVVVYAPLRTLAKAWGLNPLEPEIDYIFAYLINLAVSVLPLALAFYCFYLYLARYFPAAKVSLSVMAVLCSGLLSYSHNLWGHTTAAAFLFMAFYCLQMQQNKLFSLAVGLLCLSVLTDYLAIFSVCLICIYHLRLILKHKLKFTLISLSGASLFALYHYLAFGSVFSTGVSTTNHNFLDENLLLGVFALPDMEILWQLLVGMRRGLLVALPVFALTFFALGSGMLRRQNLRLNYFCAANVLIYLLVNAAFNGWHGGSTVLPRYLLIGLFFWLIPLAQINLRQVSVYLLVAVSALNQIIISATSAAVPDDHSSPLYGFLYEKFFSGQLSFDKRTLHYQHFYRDKAEFINLSSGNIGQLLFGLNGLYSLIPLFVCLLALILWIIFSNRLQSVAFK